MFCQQPVSDPVLSSTPYGAEPVPVMRDNRFDLNWNLKSKEKSKSFVINILTPALAAHGITFKFHPFVLSLLVGLGLGWAHFRY